ncbi:GTP-binding protein [Geobacter benzoatilyticus]|uniref:GTP-binding protein n=1 Tax=Geobacter benzoatilyticus TaxID=2815309 RepID=A0ABX7Q0Y1_9BACT|nr:ADP-ribosylation factor-like protein [Geobacter benzoatilyticus]QSV45059.1 GTP-binding protein [Geobacter benzoatilyticus]
MALINRTKREINAKIVYYGTPLAGKATTLQFIHRKLKPEFRGPIKTMGGQVDKMLFFDFMPPGLGELNDYRVRFHLYTVQGEVSNPFTWKTVLKGADGIVFVADSSPESRAATRQSMENLRSFLLSYGQDLEKLPCVVQCNKSDLPDACSPEEIAGLVDGSGFTAVKSASRSGEGVLQVLSTVVKQVMRNLQGEEQGSEPVDMLDSAPVREASEATLAGEGSPELPGEEVPANYGEISKGDTRASLDKTSSVALDGEVSVSSCGALRVPLTVRSDGGEERFVLTITLTPEHLKAE